MTDIVRINGLVLPSPLVACAQAGRWAPPPVATLERVCGDRASHPQFYSLEYMVFENKGWLAQTYPGYFGKASLEFPPGDIDKKRSVLIADLGPDQPIALDYRTDPPRVLYLGIKPDLWRLIANDIDELIALFEL